MRPLRWTVLPLLALALLGGCEKKAKPDTLVAISPHNENIRREFARAFAAHYKAQTGKDIAIEWRDVGGGANQILDFLRNYVKPGKTQEIDIVWGGGENNFIKLAEEGLLTPMAIAPEALAQIPASFGGQPLRDEQGLWVGTAISGFGMLYSKTLLERRNIAPPQKWDDLADARFFDTVSLADPTQSGSAAAAYEMIVLSEKDWPAGWAKTLAVCGNAKKFFDSAGAAANAPELGESAIATCIDFYGATRVAQNPQTLTYISPKGQTVFSPDPIGMVRGAPHPALAQAFVDFVLSKKGQALFALQVGKSDGPVEAPLGRQPIRKDVYTDYQGQMSPWIVNPYEVGNEMTIDAAFRKPLSTVLKRLIRTAAIDNRQGLQKARKKLIDSKFDPALVAEYNALPENVATREKVVAMASILSDSSRAAEIERITTDWQRFFRAKYKKIAE